MFSKIKFITGVGILCFIQLCYAFRPEVTMFLEDNYTGTALTLMDKEPLLTDLAPRITNNYKSRCFNGAWAFYSQENYTGATYSNIHWFPDTVRSYNNSFGIQDGSARYLGPQETNTPSISFYSEINFGGEELIIDGPANTDFPFAPKSYFTTGFSNWTLYSGSNFNGNVSCFRSTNEYHLMSTAEADIQNVGSMLRGCMGK